MLQEYLILLMAKATCLAVLIVLLVPGLTNHHLAELRTLNSVKIILPGRSGQLMINHTCLQQLELGNSRELTKSCNYKCNQLHGYLRA
jgi:hypothetical protein